MNSILFRWEMSIKLYEDGTIIDYSPSPGARKPPGGVLNGKKRKTFELNGKHKRFIRSSAIRQALTAKYRLLFATLTFPKDLNEHEANKCFSNFTDNLQTNFKLNSYVAVKELTLKGRPHYHILLDIPFTDFKVLNKAWCSSFRHLMPGSNNAFTTGHRPIISSVKDVAAYITKYITKVEKAQDSLKPETRQYFISKNVHCNPAAISKDMLHDLLSAHGYEKYEGDYFTWYRLWDYSVLPERELAKMQKIEDEFQSRKQRKASRKADPPPEKQLQFGNYIAPNVDFCYNS